MKNSDTSDSTKPTLSNPFFYDYATIMRCVTGRPFYLACNGTQHLNKKTYNNIAGADSNTHFIYWRYKYQGMDIAVG